MADDKTLTGVTVQDIAPDSILSDSQMAAALQAVQPQLDAVIEQRTIPALFLHFDELSSAILDHLAVQWDITTWRESWTVEQKRSILKTMFQIKSHVGTMKAVWEALSALGASVSVVEWWQKSPTGTPHTFTVYVVLSSYQGVVTDELQEDVMSLLDEAKPCRSHYEFELTVAQQGGIKATGFTRSLAFRRLKNF